MTGIRDGFATRARGVRSRVHAVPGGRLAWTIGVAVIGAVFVVGGLVLVPLPGPGWLIVFLGLGIWATEFEWAGRLLAFARQKVREGTDWILGLPKWVRFLGSLVTLVVVIAVVYLYWTWMGWWPLQGR